MRKILYLAIAIISMGAFSCKNKSHDEYAIKGSTSQARLNGEWVYLVPYGDPDLQDSIGIDSTLIQNGKFEFRSDKGEYLARLAIHKRSRFGTQELLVITEPGEITVVIDSVSSGTGTPQNDALQTWKDLKEDRDRVHWNQSQHIKYLQEQGDTVYANSLADSLRNFNEHYLSKIHNIMRNLGSGTAYDLLLQRYGAPE